MKRIYILLIAVFSLGMGGCNYVDVDPVGKVIPDEVSEYRALLTTAYSTYPQYRRYLMVRSDEVFPDLYGLSYDNYIDLATLNDENPDPLTETYPWTAMYKYDFLCQYGYRRSDGGQGGCHDGFPRAIAG